MPFCQLTTYRPSAPNPSRVEAIRGRAVALTANIMTSGGSPIRSSTLVVVLATFAWRVSVPSMRMPGSRAGARSDGTTSQRVTSHPPFARKAATIAPTGPAPTTANRFGW